jgi:Tat protein translocase TatB subunit
MGGIGASELLVLTVVALLVIGPRKLPEIARAVGQISRQAHGAWRNLKTEFQAELDNEHNRKIMEAAASARRQIEESVPLENNPDERRKGQD